MALYFQWDSNIVITECEKELEDYRLTVTAAQIASLVAPWWIAPISWGVTGWSAQRSLNAVFCTVRNTKGRLDTLYGEQSTFYLNGLLAMFDSANGLL